MRNRPLPNACKVNKTIRFLEPANRKPLFDSECDQNPIIPVNDKSNQRPVNEPDPVARLPVLLGLRLLQSPLWL